jgi:hypothetical protein
MRCVGLSRGVETAFSTLVGLEAASFSNLL